MDIKALSAIQKYAAAKPVTQAEPSQDAGGFVKVTQEFASTLRTGEETAKASMMGGADPHALVQALAQTELAVETAVTVRNKVVEAYQEILRMPV